MAGPQFVHWQSSTVDGGCNTCKDHPSTADGGTPEHAIAVFEFGLFGIRMCLVCVRRLKNQIRRAEG